MITPHLLSVGTGSTDTRAKLVSNFSDDKLSFSRFRDLPFEIRLLIWEATIEPQIVHLRQRHVSECYHAVQSVSSNRLVTDRCSGKANQKFRGCLCESHHEESRTEFDRMDRIRGRPYLHHMMGFDTDVPTPSLLLACRESYQVASKVYTKSFSALGSIAQTYFNFKTDTLYLDVQTETPTTESILQDVLPYMCQDELAEVENLAVNRNLLTETMGSYENYLACILYYFKNVKTVYLVSESELIETNRLESARDKQRPPKSLVLYEAMETSHRMIPARDCNDCREAFQRHGLALIHPDIEICEDEVHAQGKSICGGRGQQWPRPAFVHGQTITTPDMKSMLEALQRKCMEEARCGCYDIDGKSEGMEICEVGEDYDRSLLP
ncbi:hypothetical protein ONS95_010645 [Cadophora gregata]|uniref:uncharacterized protein n=1 Tax=Cadophora gregata TaxID=51156 RepID=UPI0026DC2B6D|nr:uncharacterized protein ONS95_010645 [Cadophora gregata]KAK0122406.1 hypothetical protein ONS95_010645 [Cadophora gregata]KAK0127885.1 hypothetical protein ONS96_007385 [Cadophora gregata f. sp. sojae]